MQQTVWAMDGSFFAQRISGIQRYSIELLAALDAIVPAGLVEIVVPQGVKTPAYTNIKVVPFGTRKGLAWQQLDYPCYLKQRCAKGLATCNVIPWFGFTGIAVVHDVCYRARQDFYRDTRRDRAERRVALPAVPPHCQKGRAHYYGIGIFQGQEIHKYYGVPPEKMNVVYNAWRRCAASRPMTGVFARHPQLQKGGYYFSMANLLKNKNFPWVLRAAKAKPDASLLSRAAGAWPRKPGAWSGRPAQRSLPGLCQRWRSPKA